MIGPFENIDIVVGNLLDELGISTKLSEIKIFLCWPEIVGDKISSMAQPVKFENGVLKVNCVDSIWAYELNSMKKDILSRLLKESGVNELKNIQFRQGRIEYNKRKKWKKSSILKNSQVAKCFATDEKIDFAQRAKRLLEIEDKRVAEGWIKCKKCGILVENGDICKFCKLKM